jgi:hypothetical protein
VWSLPWNSTNSSEDERWRSSSLITVALFCLQQDNEYLCFVVLLSLFILFLLGCNFYVILACSCGIDGIKIAVDMSVADFPVRKI